MAKGIARHQRLKVIPVSAAGKLMGAVIIALALASGAGGTPAAGAFKDGNVVAKRMAAHFMQQNLRGGQIRVISPTKCWWGGRDKIVCSDVTRLVVGSSSLRAQTQYVVTRLSPYRASRLVTLFFNDGTKHSGKGRPIRPSDIGLGSW